MHAMWLRVVGQVPASVLREAYSKIKVLIRQMAHYTFISGHGGTEVVDMLIDNMKHMADARYL